jgi:CBS domain-containing membrane protein
MNSKAKLAEATIIPFVGVVVASLCSSAGNQPWLMASMGATSILFFCQDTQPKIRVFILANLLAAVIGLVCVLTFSNTTLAAATTLALISGLMYFYKCAHPPAGATGLIVVLGGTNLLHQGFIQYALLPNLCIFGCLIWLSRQLQKSHTSETDVAG